MGKGDRGGGCGAGRGGGGGGVCELNGGGCGEGGRYTDCSFEGGVV